LKHNLRYLPTNMLNDFLDADTTDDRKIQTSSNNSLSIEPKKYFMQTMQTSKHYQAQQPTYVSILHL
ncbi:MAG: hypothetical protein WCH65_09195, partial [bacterium]